MGSACGKSFQPPDSAFMPVAVRTQRERVSSSTPPRGVSVPAAVADSTTVSAMDFATDFAAKIPKNRISHSTGFHLAGLTLSELNSPYSVPLETFLHADSVYFRAYAFFHLPTPVRALRS